jgi:hypothetical protein
MSNRHAKSCNRLQEITQSAHWCWMQSTIYAPDPIAVAGPAAAQPLRIDRLAL